MPLYDFKCKNKKCWVDAFEVFIPVSEIKNGAKCPKCDKKAKRIFHLNAFTFDFKAGYDTGAGAYFNSAKERDNYIAAHDLERIKC